MVSGRHYQGDRARRRRLSHRLSDLFIWAVPRDPLAWAGSALELNSNAACFFHALIQGNFEGVGGASIRLRGVLQLVGMDELAIERCAVISVARN